MRAKSLHGHALLRDRARLRAAEGSAPGRGRTGVRLAGALASLGAMAILAAALVVGCEPIAGHDRPVLLFSSDNQGVLAACGCPSNPTGGFAKREGLIEDYRRTRPLVVLVDGGDLMPLRSSPIKVKYLAQGISRAAYDALALGDAEFGLGLDAIRELQREYKLPYICANVRDASGALVVAPHVIREVSSPKLGGARKIGIFAVITPTDYDWPPQKWREELKVESPVEAAKREVGELAGCDVVVALSHQTLEESRELARAVPGIHVVICAHDRTILRQPEKVGETLLVCAGEGGGILGAMSFGIGLSARPEWALTMTELSAHVAEAPWAMDLYWAYVKEAKDKPPPDWNLAPLVSTYAAAEVCGKCHPAEFKQWSTTAHARSYESIKKTGRQDDPECLLCHTMGLGRKGGFVSMARTPELGRATCQACHIVAPDHAIRKIKPEPRININSRLCMSCHGVIQSPDFDYYVYKPKILHRPLDAGKK